MIWNTEAGTDTKLASQPPCPADEEPGGGNTPGGEGGGGDMPSGGGGGGCTETTVWHYYYYLDNGEVEYRYSTTTWNCSSQY